MGRALPWQQSVNMQRSCVLLLWFYLDHADRALDCWIVIIQYNKEYN